MERLGDYQNCTILYVDDEEKSLVNFNRVFRNKFRILSAANAAEGYRLLEEYRDDIALLISDQRMPGMPGNLGRFSGPFAMAMNWVRNSSPRSVFTVQRFVASSQRSCSMPVWNRASS